MNNIDAEKLVKIVKQLILRENQFLGYARN